MIKIVLAVVVVVVVTVFFYNNTQVESLKKMSTQLPNSQEPVSSGSTYGLSVDAVNQLSTKANDGDGNAAFRLYQYYTFSTEDKLQRRRWLEVAANAGNSTAQYNLAHGLLENKNFAEARKWALAAQKNGDESAKNLLAEIEKEQLKGK